jgi:hypothetical protein
MGTGETREYSNRYYLGGSHLVCWLCNRRCNLPLILCLIFSDAPLFGHSGGTDSSGGHHDRKNGGYHYHNSGKSSHRPPLNTFNRYSDASSNLLSVRTSARQQVSQTTRQSGRVEARPSRSWVPEFLVDGSEQTGASDSRSLQFSSLDESSSSEQRVAARAGCDEPSFLLHHVSLSPFEACSFSDDGDSWRMLTVSGSNIRLPKERICKIESVKDGFSFRSWSDASGAYSLVAKCVGIGKTAVELEKFDGEKIVVEIRHLSSADQAHIQKLRADS